MKFIEQTHFFVLTGNNAATYVVNCKSWTSVGMSLRFYKATSFKAKVLKRGLHGVLFVVGKLPFYNFKSDIQITEYLNALCKQEIPFNLDESCSVLVSPTRNKMIVHHHKQYFEKFAFGSSYQKVKNEAGIYALLKVPLKHFQISKFYDEKDLVGQYCSFKLSNTHLKELKPSKAPLNLVPLLLEFFKAVPKTVMQLDTYINTLIHKIQGAGFTSVDSQITYLNSLKKNYGATKLPLGLTHRDFKHWNLLALPKVLLFDFEETTTKGLPMEDLLNFYVDPIIKYTENKLIYNNLSAPDKQAEFKLYLNSLGINLEPQVLINLYLIERFLFWKQAGEEDTSYRYFQLSNFVLTKTHTA